MTKDLVKETLHDALYVPGEDEFGQAWSRRLGSVSMGLLWALATCAGCPAWEFTVPEGGVHLWARIPDNADEADAAFQRASQASSCCRDGRSSQPRRPARSCA